jgi:transcriptional regulator with XRE-family HTH domain
MAMTEVSPSVFARRLKDARLAVGLSQEKLGVMAGIEESSASARMNQYERGVHEPKFEFMQRLSRVLEVPVAYFAAE